ncbi:aminotransferase class I/II-fold pyridoxal phosphate-dependent enzyme [Maledivibacter halophilus]|uniref:Histidinol-phosphate aminotransferase n=1 Tax=Maledivibacter halophilus TaxID=36842 RepID=A0A1T5IDT5_9FIRM|nr:aminotransferase class I/II-fold pyridoxal phosphate-dependent enzyme [Maledivibacter halophilus]SKC37208.1 histidinol-phosphate aminotransferase [Maledivibacter halophilus]
MKYGLKANIINLNTNSYAEEKETKYQSKIIDCSIGINPFGFFKELRNNFANIPDEMINNYPESITYFKKDIINFWIDLFELKEDNILLGDGSIDIIYKINKLFLSSNSKVLGYSPQFPDYIDDVKSYDGIYDYQLMLSKNNYKFMLEPFLIKLKKDYKLIYLDNPNNPTGQVIPISYIEKIVKKAKSLGICVIVDEAYGDFMNKRNSAVSLIEKYNNVFVLRTLSKGLGLAGLRGGYLITSIKLSNYYRKISNPYSMNSIARYLASKALKNTSFIEDCKKKIRELKSELIESLNKMIVLHTDLNVPIMTIKHPNPEIDLEEELLKHNILSISGRKFIGLDKSFVRLRIPAKINPLLEAFIKIENSI